MVEALDSRVPADYPSECPECSGKGPFNRDGVRQIGEKEQQRWLCKACGYRFTEGHIDSKSVPNIGMSRQLCAILQDVKKLDLTAENKAVVGDLKQHTDQKGSLIDYIGYLRKEGYADETVKARVKIVTQLWKEGANLVDPEDVKRAIASKTTWCNGHKLCGVNAYNTYLEMLGLTWKPPCYIADKSLPFVPLEKEIDALISGTGRKTSTVLQLLKETGLRIGEAWDLKWNDIDQEKSTVRTKSEKHGDPRELKISAKCLAMLNRLPKRNEYVMGNIALMGFRWNYDLAKKKLSIKLQNPRIKQIKLHSLRHYFATMEYQRTKDLLYVKNRMGHRDINSTLVYTRLVAFGSNDYFSATAQTVEDAAKLVEQGFEYVTEFNDVKLFRKRK